ncbi:MAG: ABC-type Na+ efflux pump, permease component [Lacunisphaera sp.]|nr:ABC-type Na+ efflux pump, permease component [Lacunisphaera sp.]
MNWNNILTIYLKELRDSLRDRRTLISIIVIPTLVMPIMFFGIGKIMSKVMSSAQEEIPTVMILGGGDAPELVAQLTAARDPDRDRPLFRVVPGTEYKQAITDKKLRVALEIPAGFEAALKAGDDRTVKIYYFEGEIKSGIGSKALDLFLANYREKYVVSRLAEHGLPASLVRPFTVKRQNVAPPEKVGGNLFGGFVPYLIIILCFTGAMYPAIDLTAGEKERGTMETLLCSPVRRINIVLGKFLMVLTGSLAAMVFMLLSMGLTASVGSAFFMSGAAGKGAAAGAVRVATPVDMIPTIDPAGLLGVLAMVAPVAILFAALLLAISLFAKSYKEAQSYVSPMIIVVIMPAVVGMLPGVELNAKLALVPILNLSLVCKEMLSGVWHWNYIALIFGSSCLYAGIALAFAVRMFNREDVMFRA